MPFSPDVKAKMFIKCARICCLCFKPCGTNIEASHIIAEASGGSNIEDNGIPLCFDCHQETGAYDIKHPKGNKFSIEELKARRDNVYNLVASGSLQAQIITRKWQNAYHDDDIPANEKPYIVTKDLEKLLRTIGKGTNLETLPMKFNHLDEREQAYFLDNLMVDCEESRNLKAICSVVSNAEYDKDKGLIILNQLLKKANMYFSLEQKKDFLEAIGSELLKLTDEGLRKPFYIDLVTVLEFIQFDEVNLITASVIKVQNAMPIDLHARYVLALMKLADHHANRATPASQNALSNLPYDIAKAFFSLIDNEFIFWNFDKPYFKKFLKDYKILWPKRFAKIYSDILSLRRKEFYSKYPKRNLED